MAEDKGQNVKINLPTKTDDPKLSVGLVMVGGAPSVNSIYAALPTQFVLPFGGRREKRRHGIKRPPQAPAAPLHMFLFPNLIIPTPTRARYLRSVLRTQTLFLFFAACNCLSCTSILILSYWL